MSVRITTWAWEQRTLSSGERLVLLALSDHAGDDGMCYPGTGRLAEKCGFSSSTSVRNHLDTLEARGLIRKVVRRRKKGGQLSTWLYCVGPHARTLDLEDVDTSASAVAVDQRQPSAPTSASAVAVGQRQPGGALNHQVSNHQGEPPDTPPPAEAGGQADLAAEFDAFWQVYPRRVGKPEALKAYVRARQGYTQRTRGVQAEHPPAEKRDLSVGLGRWLQAWEHTDLELIPHPATWLNQRRWEDIPPPTTRGHTAHDRTRSVLEDLAASEQRQPAAGELGTGGAA